MFPGPYILNWTLATIFCQYRLIAETDNFNIPMAQHNKNLFLAYSSLLEVSSGDDGGSVWQGAKRLCSISSCGFSGSFYPLLPQYIDSTILQCFGVLHWILCFQLADEGSERGREILEDGAGSHGDQAGSDDIASVDFCPLSFTYHYYLTVRGSWEMQSLWPGKKFSEHVTVSLGFPSGSVVKNPPTKQEKWVQYLGQEDPLENEMATDSSILTWEIPWTRSLAAIVHGVSKSWT